MVNAEGFSGLKSMIVKQKYQNLVSYKWVIKLQEHIKI
jgi:hypothetical protein